jgi:predicted dinucleotide-binding enzyme
VLSVASDLRSTDALSLAQRTQDVVRGPVVAGLHSLAAGKLAQGRPAEDAFVCGDDAGAKELALELAAKVVAGRALDAGPLSRARALEGMTAVIISLNKRYKGHAGIRITGLP